MAFNNWGSWTKNPGIPVTIGYGWGGSLGAQAAEGIPSIPFYNALLISTNLGVIMDTNNKYWYQVTVTNEGPLPATFSLSGGGYS